MMPRDPSRPYGHVTDRFETVTRATQDQLGGAWNSAFRAGDQLQRGMVDMMFSFFSLDAWNPNRMMRTTSDMMQRSMGAAGQMAGAAQNAWPGSGTGSRGQQQQQQQQQQQNANAWPGSGTGSYGQQQGGWPGAGSGSGSGSGSGFGQSMQSAMDAASQAVTSATVATADTMDAMASAVTPPAGWRVTTPRDV
jgi:hypothetical protein